jgi:hypothetical protein
MQSSQDSPCFFDVNQPLPWFLNSFFAVTTVFPFTGQKGFRHTASSAGFFTSAANIYYTNIYFKEIKFHRCTAIREGSQAYDLSGLFSRNI